MLTDGQVNSSSSIQPQAPVQTLQPAAAAAPNAAISSVGSSVGTSTRFQFHWSHAILAVGLLAVSGAGTAVVVKVSTLTSLLSCLP
jgi:peroxin-14